MHEGGRHTAISKALNNRNAETARPETCGLVSKFVPNRASFRFECSFVSTGGGRPAGRGALIWEIPL